MTHASDGFRAGTAPAVGATRPGFQGNNQTAGGGLPLISANTLPPRGKGAFMSPQYVYSVIPLTIQAANIAATQTPAGSGNLVLTAGTGTTAGTVMGVSVIFLDIARAIRATTAGSETGVSLTITGYDWYLQPQTATIALPSSATTVTSTKTFYAISSISASGATTLAITVGTSDVFGLIYSCTDKTLLIPKWNNTVAIDTATVVVADATTPTASTGDVRGTVTPSTGASDGVKRLTVWQVIINPDTDTGLYGVTPA